MASRPENTTSPRQLLTLGMFIFGMDTLAYSEFDRRIDWRHASSERHGQRNAYQYIGAGQDVITLGGLLVPEIQGSYGDLARLIEMADTGDHWPLVNGNGIVLGEYFIVNIEQSHKIILAGGIPRMVDFIIDLERHD